MRESGDRRLRGALTGKFSERAFIEAAADKNLQKLLGWIKPKRWRVKVKPAVRKWKIVGYEELIKEAERRIVKLRKKQRELGAELPPYSPERIRRLEEEYFEEREWRKSSRRTATREKKWRK